MARTEMEQEPLNDPKEDDQITTSPESSNGLLYGLEDIPPWYLSFLYGFQHYLVMIGTTVTKPLILASFLCLGESDPARGALVSNIIFVSGIATLLQSTLGVRLPIIQGGSFTYLMPAIMLVTTTFPECPAVPPEQRQNMTEWQRAEVWQERFRYVQGAIVTSSLVQVLVGFTGVIGLALPYITPLTVAPTVTLLGLSLFDVISKKASGHWPIFAMVVILGILFSQYLGVLSVPLPLYTRKRGFHTHLCQPFRTLSLLFALVISWVVCWVLTVTDVLPAGSEARTDISQDLIHSTPWFRLPYPGQFGAPTMSIAGTLSMLACVFSSIIESVGDYYTCARIVGAKIPSKHAINRGIGVEGLGCLLAGLIGTGSGTTSYSGNIGVLAITRVGSRRMIQYSGLIMVACGLITKIGAIFVTLPSPVIAGVFMLQFGIITAVGITTLKHVDLESSRNIFVIGFSLIFGLSIPKWLEAHPGVIQTGSVLVDQTLTVLLQTSMFIGGFTGFFLDNTIPGTDKERGVLGWRSLRDDTEVQGDNEQLSSSLMIPSSYDLPFGMTWMRRSKWLHHIPFCPDL